MATWLDLVTDDEGWSFVDTGRLNEIVNSIRHPQSQHPSFICFLGNSNRIKALRVLFPQNNVTRKGPAGLIRLHLSATTAHTSNPIIFAESGLFNPAGVGDSKWLRSATEKHRRYRLTDVTEATSAQQAQREIIRQRVLPWVHALYLFVDSPAELKDACDFLQQPRQTLTVGGHIIPRHMRTVVVLANQPQNGIHLTKKDVYTLFNASEEGCRTTILDLRSRSSLSDTVAFEPLRALILDQLHTVHANQRQNSPPFSAHHLGALWNHSVRRHGHQLNPFDLDCLSVARSHTSDILQMRECLIELKQQTESFISSVSDVYEFVASALLLDAYPPGMHRFPPTLMFDALYRKHCQGIWDEPDAEGHCEGILARFNLIFKQLAPGKSSAAIRRDKMMRFYQQWGGLYSTTTCFACLRRPPEHMMQCRHAICENCVVIFGTTSTRAHYHTILSECPFCSQSVNLTIRHLPPTKRPIVFSLDGGGVRGIIQLGLLRALEKRLGVPVAQIPDLCTGTSVGALSEMDMILNGVSAAESFAKFPSLARRIFQSPFNTYGKSPLFRCIRWISSAVNLFADGQYSSSNLEQVLKEAVDPQRRLFDVSTTSPAACRVAIITSRTSDGKACVLANYRGSGHRDQNLAYEFLLPKNERENPPLWEAAQCSVAAPFYFQTKTLPGFGPMQDGGVRANNPLAIALKESAAIWPDARRHDLLLSIGTGFSPSQLRHPGEALEATHDGALPRLIRATMWSPCMDGEQGFNEALNYVPDHAKSDIFRLNHAMGDPLPPLDDTSRLTEMANIPFVVPDELVRALLATGFFFFELDERPTQSQTTYFCQGSIMCARTDAHDILDRMLVEFPVGLARTRMN